MNRKQVGWLSLSDILLVVEYFSGTNYKQVRSRWLPQSSRGNWSEKLNLKGI